MSEQGGLPRSCLSFKFGQAPAICPLGLALFDLFLLKLCPPCSPPPPPHPALLPLPLHFFKWSIWEICLNCPPPPQSPFSTISLFQPFLDMHLSQLLTNKTKTTPQTNQSFGFPYASCPFWQYPLMRSEGHGHLQRAVLCSHAKGRVENRSGPWQTRAREQRKGFAVSTTTSPAPPVSYWCSVW